MCCEWTISSPFNFTDSRDSEHGIATHYIPSSRIPQLLAHLSALDNPTLGQVDRTIEELFQEREANEPPTPLIGPVRTALDAAFGYDQVEHIIDHLRILATGSDESIVRWAEQTISDLEQRSPTSLKVALQAIRLGKHMPVKNCLEMELGIATAFCVSPFDRTPVFLPYALEIQAWRQSRLPNWR
jgi:3-hydroxyisobutyryl-CoA hydrolase